MEREETRETAALEFEPWSDETIGEMVQEFSEDGWSLKPDCPIAVDLRIATIILSKTKEELADTARALGTAVFEILDHLQQSADGLDALVKILSAARARQAIGAAVHADRTWEQAQ